VTLKAVTHLAQHCPNLIGFSLALNCSKVAQHRKTMPTDTTPHNDLEWIILGDSHLEDVKEVVDLLLDWFPSLRRIQHSLEPDETWESVMQETRRSQQHGK